MAIDDNSELLLKLKKINIENSLDLYNLVPLLQEINKKFESSTIPYDISEYLFNIRFNINSASLLLDPFINPLKLLADNCALAPLDQKPQKLAKIKELVMEIKNNPDDSIMQWKGNVAINIELISRLYSLEDPELTALLQQHYKIPRRENFKSGKVPKVVLEKEAPAQETINNIASKIKANQAHGKTMELQDFEDRIIKVQRKVRGNIRRKNYNKTIAKNLSLANEQSEAKISANIKAANKPYLPKCSNQALARRIYRLAHEVHFIADMNHLTSAQYLDSILDNGISGRKTLMNSLVPFVPAALDSLDLQRGDGNAVCCGPSRIDPITFKSIRTAKITFDFSKVTATNNPHMFFKQRDLGFTSANEYLLTIGGLELSFELKGFDRTTSMAIHHNKKLIRGKIIPSILLVSHNVAAIEPIFILNFFRFLDITSEADKLSDDVKIIEKFYEELNKLSDDELKQVLHAIGTGVTQTAEINFESLFKFDIAMVKNIALCCDEYTTVYNLNLEQLIAELNQDNTATLIDAKKNIPELFRSYRLKQFLLSNVIDPKSIAVINSEFEAVEYKQTQFEKLKQRDISEAKTSTAKKHNNTETTTQPAQKPKT